MIVCSESVPDVLHNYRIMMMMMTTTDEVIRFNVSNSEFSAVVGHNRVISSYMWEDYRRRLKG